MQKRTCFDISKEEFCSTIKKLMRVSDTRKNIDKMIFDSNISNDYYGVPYGFAVFHTDSVIELLRLLVHDETELLDWWIYDNDFGRGDLKMWDRDDNEIDISSADKLYDYFLSLQGGDLFG